MAELTEGTVRVSIPEGIEIPERAGSLSTEEVRSYPNPRPGLGLVAAQTATEMEKSGFEVPGVTAEELRRRGGMAEEIDEVIHDVELLLTKLKQANTMIDAEAYNLLRRVNDQVKSAAKFDASVKDRFSAITSYFGRSKRSGGSPE